MIKKKHHTKGILFDLDGTILDTAEDLGTALNRVLETRDIAPLDLSSIRPFAGRGCKGLLKLGMNIDDDHPDYTGLCDQLLGFYDKHFLETTQLFSGMDAILTHLSDNNIPWGIVTNKPKKFTSVLLDHLGLKHRATCVISGDSLTERKPHPAPVLHACELLKQSPSDCLYIGDAEIDMIASKAAGTAAIVAMYGYIAPDEKPNTWNADGFITHPSEILNWL